MHDNIIIKTTDSYLNNYYKLKIFQFNLKCSRLSKSYGNK